MRHPARLLAPAAALVGLLLHGLELFLRADR